MNTLHFDLTKTYGTFKPLNAVNNGPIYKRHANDQWRTNIDTYKAMRIPYARNHDASYHPTYGGEHTVDISAIFPNFDANPYDLTSYDFACTDEYTCMIMEDAGTEVFFRLGQKIEHFIKQYNIHPPKDFKKWAIICEHIIRHYNEGWANGYHLNIQYWEIWNEPDLSEDKDIKNTWSGTRYEFHDFYEIAAKHLKACFPTLKIGGPAIAWNLEWADVFLCEMQKRNVPIDFFSWHIYCSVPQKMLERAEAVRELMDKYGYQAAESILNEWNYICGWTDRYIESIETIISIKGAAFISACLCLSQPSSIDMLMYYDARPGALNSLFDYYTLRPIKGYYPMYWYGKFYDGFQEVRPEESLDDIYSLCGVDQNGKTLTALTYYTDEKGMPEREVTLDFGRTGTYEIYLLDETHDGTLVDTVTDLTFTLKPNTCLLIKEN